MLEWSSVLVMIKEKSTILCDAPCLTLFVISFLTIFNYHHFWITYVLVGKLVGLCNIYVPFFDFIGFVNGSGFLTPYLM